MKAQKLIDRNPAEHNTDVNFSVGVELPIRAMGVNFMPSWWHEKHGIEFGERYIFDADYRVETVRYKWKEINKLYPELNLGDPDPKPEVIPADFHNSLGPAAMGCELVFPVNNYPISKHADEDTLKKMQVPDDIENTYPYNEMIRQVKYLNNKLNKDKKPFIFKNGVLNDALLLRGDSIFLDLIEDEDIGRHVLDLSIELGYRVFDYNFKQKSMPEIMPLCNCTAQLIGPKLYEDVQLEYDQKLAAYINNNGTGVMIHHCGTLDGFIDHYKKLPKLAMIQMGHKSDVKLALDSFPEILIDYCFSSSWLISASAGDVREHTRKILDDSRGNRDRFSISIGDLDVNTDENHVKVIFETMLEYA